MADTVSPTKAVAALQDYFGPRLEAGHDDGLRLMADALREELSISPREARKLVEELEKARTIRWRTGRPRGAAIPGASQNLAAGTGTPAQPAIGVGGHESYWQLGAGEG